MSDQSQPKCERLFTVPGTHNTIRVTCEREEGGTDTTSVSVSFNVAGRVTTPRLIATADRLLFARALDVCAASTDLESRQRVKSLADYLDAWYHEYVGPHFFKALGDYVNSPCRSSGTDQSGDSGG